VNRAESAQWRTILKQALADTRCATPAFLVKDMDQATQTVTVQIAIQERVRTAKGPQWWDVPAIVMVPVVTPRGGGYSVTLPLKKGDEGLLVFCDTCFDLWWKRGQTGAPTAANVAATAQGAGLSPTPSGSQRQNEIRRHYVHDCGFIPGMWSQPNRLANYSVDSLQIRSDDGATVIDVSATMGVTITAPAITLNVVGDINAAVGGNINAIVGGDATLTATGVVAITGSDVDITPLDGGGF
jgi:hypothetical protein